MEITAKLAAKVSAPASMAATAMSAGRRRQSSQASSATATAP
jgi:hypothetical protein